MVGNYQDSVTLCFSVQLCMEEKKAQMRSQWEQLFERCQVTSHRHILYIAPNIANRCSAMTTMSIGALKVYLTWYLASKFKDVFVWLRCCTHLPQGESWSKTYRNLYSDIFLFQINRNYYRLIIINDVPVYACVLVHCQLGLAPASPWLCIIMNDVGPGRCALPLIPPSCMQLKSWSFKRCDSVGRFFILANVSRTCHALDYCRSTFVKCFDLMCTIRSNPMVHCCYFNTYTKAPSPLTSAHGTFLTSRHIWMLNKTTFQIQFWL